ncbi:helix-turn-helix domain-containing protein [Caloramator sp. ALD01]|uniref:winged helix-turn-helix transcriptional regulator n=1 Tax=Caloramator sp. ALD01 TaxID=1031288 RepID=UPI0003FF809A|nr:helix-turn-helix domain-containing protein [Caloramator sp. ALD01]
MHQEKTYNCPVEYTLSIIGGKWKTVILWHLSNNEVLRYGELKRLVNGITHKTLSNQLKELEADGLINRKEYYQIPPKVEYSLTEKGKGLMPILKALCEWGSKNM